MKISLLFMLLLCCLAHASDDVANQELFDAADSVSKFVEQVNGDVRLFEKLTLPMAVLDLNIKHSLSSKLA